MMKLFSTLALFAVLIGYASAQCTASLNATRQASWVDNMVSPRSLWTVVITAGQLPVSNVLLDIVGSINQIWEVTLVRDTTYQLPDWRLQIGGIPAGQSHVFGFIINNNNTESPVSLESVLCPNVSPTPSPVVSASPSRNPAASASASASPSRNPAASASSSPSPTINTPVPSGGVCSLAASQVARTGAGGMWTDSSFRYQIYDITIRNNGTRALVAASITINIAADQEFNQFWNLVRVGTSNTFTIDRNLLPGPGASQSGIGYVLRTPLNSTSDGSSIGSVTFAC